MIEELHIENLAVREDATLEFDKRDVALVGETGAGKSLVVSSLLLLRGERADYSLVRDKKKKACISALFSLPEKERKVHKEWEEYLEGSDLLLKRVLNPDKSSRFYINGQPVTLMERKTVTSHLIDIHSQASRYDLLDEEKQLFYLDLYGKGSLAKAKEDFSLAYKDYLCSVKEKEELLSGHKERDRDYLSFQIKEIEKYGLRPNEIEDLNKEYLSFREREERKKKYDGFRQDVEGENSLSSRLDLALEKLHPFLDTSKKQEAESLRGKIRETRDALSSFCCSFSSVEENSKRRDEINARLFQLKDLRRKYGKSTKEILGKYEYFKKCLSERDSFDSLLAGKEKAIKEKYSLAREKAKILSLEREKAAKGLEKEIGKTREALGLKKDGFKAALVPSSSLTANGLEHASFLVCLNKGLDYALLKKAASGGEASRLRLALKAVLNNLDPYDLLVLDEIDTGVSGKQAARRAKRFKERSSLSQVLLISHLPQVLSSVDEAILIEKKRDKEGTRTTAKKLTKEETIKEIGLRLSGEKESSAALRQAEILYGEYHKD